MEHLGEDVIFEIISYLDAVSATKFLLASKKLWECRHKPKFSSRIDPYMESIKFHYWDQGMCIAVQNFNLCQMHYFIEKGANEWGEGLASAIRSKQDDLVNFFLSKGVSKEEGLSAAVEVGNYAFVEQCIGEVDYLYDAGLYLVEYLETAALKGHKDLVELFVAHSALDWSPQALYNAASGGHKDIVEYLLEQSQAITEGLEGAIYGNHQHICDLLIEKGADVNEGMVKSVEHSRKELIEYFVHRGATNWNAGLAASVYIRDESLMDFFLNKGADWNTALVEAVDRYSLTQVLDVIISKGADDLNAALLKATESDKVEFVIYLIEKGADNLEEALQIVSARGGYTKAALLSFIERRNRMYPKILHSRNAS